MIHIAWVGEWQLLLTLLTSLILTQFTIHGFIIISINLKTTIINWCQMYNGNDHVWKNIMCIQYSLSSIAIKPRNRYSVMKLRTFYSREKMLRFQDFNCSSHSGSIFLWYCFYYYIVLIPSIYKWKCQRSADIVTCLYAWCISRRRIIVWEKPLKRVRFTTRS